MSVIVLGPGNPDGWSQARELGLLDCGKPVHLKPLALRFKPPPMTTADQEPSEYHRYRARATPKWLTPEERSEMRALYKLAAGPRRKKRGLRWSVDHIVPLRAANVCGLHVPWNLRLVPLRENQRKNNRQEEDGAPDRMNLGTGGR